MLVAVASVAGAALQLVVQLPRLFKLERKLRVSLDLRARERARGRRELRAGVLRARRGADQRIRGPVARVVPRRRRGVGARVRAERVDAPDLAVRDGDRGVGAARRCRPRPARARTWRRRSAGSLDEGLRRIAFYIVPSAAAFLRWATSSRACCTRAAQFKRDGTVWVWGVLAGSAVGLLAGTMGRLYSSAWYAQRDTRHAAQVRDAARRAHARPRIRRGAHAPGMARHRRQVGRRPASPRPPASPAGWSSGCCAAR